MSYHGAMSEPEVQRKRLSGAESWKIIFRRLRSPAILVAFAFVCVGRPLTSALVYASMRTFLYVPSGAYVWALLVLTVLGSVTMFSMFIRGAVTARRLRLSGIRRSPNLWYFTGWFVLLQLAIPFSVALFLWSDMGDPEFLYKSGGHFKVMSRRQNLQHILRAMEKRGVFTPFTKG